MAAATEAERQREERHQLHDLGEFRAHPPGCGRQDRAALLFREMVWGRAGMSEFFVAGEDVGEMLKVVAAYPGCPAHRVMAAFTEPAALAQWWGGELSTRLVPGGDYTVKFAKPGTRMSGQIVRYDPPAALEFTWNWEHEPGAPRRTASISLSDDGAPGGTTLVIVHGPFDRGPAGAADRASVRQGWEYFLPRLAASLGAR